MELSKISTLFFDLDDTLLDHSSAEKRAKRELYEKYNDLVGGIPFADWIAVYRKHNSRLWNQLEKGEVNGDYVRYRRFADTLADFDLPTKKAAQLGENYLEIYSQHWQLCDGALEVLNSLKSRFRLGLITNGFSDVQHKKFAQFDLKRHFHSILISNEFGIMKPNRGIFEEAEKRAQATSDEIAHIGDSYLSDIVGAKSAGWSAIWIRAEDNSFQNSIADVEIQSLNELPEIFGI